MSSAEDLQLVDEVAVLVGDADAVGVAVRRDADVVAAAGQRLRELLEVARDRLRRMQPGERRVAETVELLSAACVPPSSSGAK